MNDQSCIEWAVAQRPFPGEMVSGDTSVIQFFPGGVLLGVVDGLGHGPEAAHAATLAADSLRRSAEWGLAEIVRECHEALRGSRGAVLTAAVYRPDPGTLEWTGIGNVEGVVWHRPGDPEGRRLHVTPRGGVVGYQIPSPHITTVPVAPGDLCCLASDGIASSFIEKTPAFLAPGALAAYVLERYGRTTDDALVLAARFLGAGT